MRRQLSGVDRNDFDLQSPELPAALVPRFQAGPSPIPFRGVEPIKIPRPYFLKFVLRHKRSLLVSVLLFSITLGQTIANVEGPLSGDPDTAANSHGAYFVNVTVGVALDMIESLRDLVVIDIRTPQQYFEGHLPNAVSVPFDLLNDSLGEFDTKTDTLVYCDSGERSQVVSSILVERGFEKVYNMQGGFAAWKDAGLPAGDSTTDEEGCNRCVNTAKASKTKKTKVERMNASRIDHELRNINAQISSKKAKWTTKETGVSRLSFKDRKRLFALISDRMPKGTQVLSAPGGVTVPFGTFDWRNVDGVNWMTPIKNQGPCGSCWAFGTLGSMEAVINIAYNDPTIDVDLSEQVLVSCCRGSYPLCGFGCSGGYPDAAYNYIKNNGVPDEACFPYVASDVACDTCSDRASRAWFIRNWSWLSNDRSSIKWALQTYGPLGVAMRAPDDFLYYGGGIYQPIWSSPEWDKEFPFGQANHWVTLVGYDDIGQYWIVKNSWGEGWGEGGYGRIQYGVLEQHDFILAITSVEGPVAPEHDLEVSLQAASILRPGSEGLLTVTVHNQGVNDETNVEVLLYANGVVIDSATIPSLAAGSSQSVSRTWSQTIEGTYNTTAYSPPVLDEDMTSNNVATEWTTVTGADILLVADDDGSYSLSGTSQVRFENALTSAGVDYLVWVESARGRPSLDALNLFQTVIWTCGDYWSGAVDSVDAGNLESYLAQGGAVLLEGEDIGFDHRSDGFMRAVAHAYYQVDAVGSSGIHKTALMHPVASGLPEYVYWQLSPSYDDGVTPWNGGSEVFEYYPSSPYSAVVASGVGGEGSTVFLAYPLYCMSVADANPLVGNAVDWLGFVVTFDCSPRVASLAVDGVRYGASELPRSFNWRAGSTHSFNVETAVPGGVGARYAFTTWSDGNPSASRTVSVSSSATYTAHFKSQYALSILAIPAGGGATNPSSGGSPYWKDAGTTVSVTATPNAEYSFYYWSLDGANIGSSPSYTVLMDSAHTLTAFFRGTSSMSLDLSAGSITLGDSVTLSGTVSPAQSSPRIPSGTVVVLSYSLDRGASWNSFIMTQTDGVGAYSVIWYPPHRNIYQITASWSGNADYAGSTSSTASLTVTGTSPPQVMLLVAGPVSVTTGGTAVFDVLVTNPGSSLTTTLYIEVVGPGGYRYFDSVQVSVAAGSTERFQFAWQAPFASGTYQVLVGFIPPKPASISQTQITIT